MAVKKNANVPPRPKCMCGNPATHKVTIEVNELKLIKRDNHQKYWGASYDDETSIRVMLCVTCVKSSVNLNINATASVISEDKNDVFYNKKLKPPKRHA